MLKIVAPLAAFLMFMTPGAAPSQGAPVADEMARKDLIRLHRLIGQIREFDADLRELYHDQSFVLPHLHGARTEWIGSYNEPTRLLTQAVDSRFVPKFRRLAARIDGMTDLTAEQAGVLRDALTHADVAIEAGHEIAERLRADDLTAATGLFHDRSLLAFKAGWRETYTLVSALEGDFPRR